MRYLIFFVCVFLFGCVTPDRLAMERISYVLSPDSIPLVEVAYYEQASKDIEKDRCLVMDGVSFSLVKTSTLYRVIKPSDYERNPNSDLPKVSLIRNGQAQEITEAKAIELESSEGYNPKIHGVVYRNVRHSSKIIIDPFTLPLKYGFKQISEKQYLRLKAINK